MHANMEQVKAIFLEAVEKHAPDEWGPYLDNACQGDAALRQQIELLLEAHAGASLLEKGALAAPTIDQAVAEITEQPGTQIGPYKLLQQIGEGGMGVVYMAEQTEPVERRVALKIIKPGMDTRQVISRFEAERQALAMMDHPNIARVLDAGTTDSGRPYFVMELVKGVPVTQYCDEQHLTPRERLELFVPICQAIQHAHQKGIIHRDLKPTNILVAEYDDRPVPKIIDFGVAKAVSQRLTEKTMFTQYGQIVGTIEYMSPEQAKLNQLDVDTRSDIYSLGVLLYELLTGETPFDKQRLRSAAFDELLRIIREEEPPRPSTRLSSSQTLPSIAANRKTQPQKLSGLVRGDLDWIVMKALEKDRARRYDTANAFARDVQRYLGDEPVEACPPSAAYRFRKFARRNRGRLAAGGILAAALLVTVASIGWAVRDRAARETEIAHQSANREAELERERKARQAKVAGQVDSLLAEADRLEKEQKWPEALAAARRAAAAVAGGEAEAETAARVRSRLKDLEFIDRLEQIRMQRGMWIEGKFDNAGADRDYARAFRDYGVDVERLSVEEAVGGLKTRPALAIPLTAALDDWVYARRKVAKQDDAGWKRLVAVACGIDPDRVRDRLRSTWGRPDSEVQDELRRLAESIDIRAQHPATLFVLAHNLQGVNLDSAIRILRDAIYVYPGDFWLNYSLGQASGGQGDHEGAIRYYTAAVAVRPHSTAALNNLGLALMDENRPDEAITCYRKAIEIDPEFSYAWNGLGNALVAQKRSDEAVVLWRKALELSPNWACSYNGLGNALRDQNKLDEAAANYRKAIEIDPEFAYAWNGLGNVLRSQKHLDQAIAAFRQAIEIDPNDATPYNSLGALLCDDLKDYDRAIECLHKAIELDPNSAHAYGNLGNALHHQKKLDQAVDAYEKAIQLDPKFANAYNGLANALGDQGKLDEAVTAFDKAIELDPHDAKTYRNFGTLLAEDLQEYDRAIAVYDAAIELDPNDAGAYVGRGNVLHARKKPDEAIACFHAALALDPQDANAYLGLGNALHAQGKLDEAVDAYRKAIDVAPNYAKAHNNLGNVLRDQKKLEEAIAAYEKAIELDPHDARTYSNLGRLLCDDLRDYVQACECFRKAIELDPKNAGAYHDLGVALSGLGKLDEAIAVYRKAIELDPNMASAYYGLGNALFSQTKLDEAVEAYRKAIELDPKDVKAHNNLGNALLSQTKLDEAVAAFRQAIELDPKYAMAHINLGIALGAQGKLDEAVAAFQKAIELDPGFVAAYDYLGALLCDDLKEYGQAVECFRKAIELDPNNAGAYGNLGNALYHQRQWPEAIDACKKSLAIDPQFANAQNTLAWLLATCPDAKLRDPTQAVALAKESVERAPNNAGYLNTLGVAHYRARDYKAAIAALEKSMTWHKGGNSNDWFFLAMAHWQLGEQDQARQWYDKAVEWMEKNQPTDEELLRFRAEASELLGPNEK